MSASARATRHADGSPVVSRGHAFRTATSDDPGTRLAVPQFCLSEISALGHRSARSGLCPARNSARLSASLLETGSHQDSIVSPVWMTLPCISPSSSEWPQVRLSTARSGRNCRARGYPSASTANWRTPLHYWTVARGRDSAHGARASVILARSDSAPWRVCPAPPVPRIVVRCWCAPAGGHVASMAFRPAGIVMAEYWAGMLVALALAFYHFRWWTAAACCGVVAIFVRELAVPFGVICGLFALSERRHRESAVWVVGGLAYVACYLLHAQAVSAAMLPTDWSWPHSWGAISRLAICAANRLGCGKLDIVVLVVRGLQCRLWRCSRWPVLWCGRCPLTFCSGCCVKCTL